MLDGPMNCQEADASAAGTAALAERLLALRAFVLPLRPGEPSAAAAFANAAANGLVAGTALRLGTVLAFGNFERIAFLVSPNAGRAFLGTANVITTASFSMGSRSPR